MIEQEYLDKLHNYALLTAVKYPHTNEYILEMYDDLSDLIEEKEIIPSRDYSATIQFNKKFDEKLKEIRLLLVTVELKFTQ